MEILKKSAAGLHKASSPESAADLPIGWGACHAFSSLRHQRSHCSWADMNLLITFLALLSFDSAGWAHAQTASEYEVKAAFLYNFAKFVEWPPEAFRNDGEGDSALIVGIIGNDPFGGVIDQIINGKTINGRPMMIKRLMGNKNLRQCHILFIGSSENKRLPQIFESLKGASVLTISEMNLFNQQGGIINFVMESSRVRFEINAFAAEQAQLKISSKLLVLAKTVRGGKGLGRN
jgi:hypothetical protein